MNEDTRTAFAELSHLVSDTQLDLNLKRPEIDTLIAGLREALEDKERLIRRIGQLRDHSYSSLIEELHSGPLQLLASRCLLYQQRTQTVSEASEVRYQADLLVKDVVQAIEQVRRILRNSLSEIAEHDLLTQLREVIRKESRITLEILPDDDALIGIPAGLANLIRAFVEETIVNARKHANATEIYVTIVREENGITLRTADNGRGFEGGGPNTIQDLQAYFDRGHLGLRLLAELAHPLHGELSFLPKGSELGGAEIRLTLPL